MYDTIIVGAGPAGATAAYHLAKKGHSVLLLEKESLPRYKPCGGGVSPAIAQWFDFDFSPAISVKVDSLRFTWKMGDPVEAKVVTKEPIWMVRRDIFDNFLVEKAREQGCCISDNTEVTGIEFKNDYWQVNTAKGPVTGRYLIAADGAKGNMAKWLGFKDRKRTLAAALEAEVAANVVNKSTAHFEFGLIKNGYIWNFPKADGYSIGVGTFIGGSPGQNFKKILDEYAQSFDLDIKTGQQYGHPLCLWNGDQKLHTQNAILAGEAACVVDPMTAEGIRPSIFSALLAAASIDQALSHDINALEKYSAAMNEQWGSEMAWAQKLAGAFYRFPAIAYKVGVKHPSSPKTMVQLLSGEVHYREVTRQALKRLIPGL
jgi:geranylgeranyl reductase family protein